MWREISLLDCAALVPAGHMSTRRSADTNPEALQSFHCEMKPGAWTSATTANLRSHCQIVKAGRSSAQCAVRDLLS